MDIVAFKRDLLPEKREGLGNSALRGAIPGLTSKNTHFSDEPLLRASGLTSGQASALKTLVFSGPRFGKLPHLKIEAKFIQDLARSGNNEEKAAIAEMLGRAKSMNAIPALVSLVKREKDPQVRAAAVTALGEIGDSTHLNSFTRVSLSNTLVQLYHERKSELVSSVLQGSGTYLPVGKRLEQQFILKEMKPILKAIGKLKVIQGNELLQQEYKDSLDKVNNALKRVEELAAAIKNAESAFVEQLEKQHQKPIHEIKTEIPLEELEDLYSRIQVPLQDGTKVGIEEAKSRAKALQGLREFANHLLIGALDGMAQQNSKQVNNYLKQGLAISNPIARVMALNALAQRNELSYGTDIYPNLLSKSVAVRHAALNAMLGSNEAGAKQKLMELLNPQAFIELTEVPLNQEGLDKYTQFLNKLAQNGDKHKDFLSETAMNPDYAAQTRQIALLVLSMMIHQPNRKSVSDTTVEASANVLRKIALHPTGQDKQERQSLALLGTKLWLGMKEPKAVIRALELLTNSEQKLSIEMQEDLLLDIYAAFQENPDRPVNSNRQKSILASAVEHSSPLKKGDREAISKFAKGFRTKVQENLLSMESKTEIGFKISQEPLNKALVQEMQPDLKSLRPALMQMLEDKASPIIRMAAARILGALQDKDSATVAKLIAGTRDPLKGLVNWNREPSFFSSASSWGANVRANNIVSLGQIGHAAALDVMLDALDDPGLRRATLEPLAQLAKETNRINDSESLHRVRDKLLQVMSNPDNSRLARAVRISAASALCQFNGGVDGIKQFIKETQEPNFKRHAISALIANDYATAPDHPDYGLVKDLLSPELGVGRLHKAGLTGKGVDIAVVDGGYVDKDNSEAFQDRVKLPAHALDPEHTHPTMVATTAAGNGKIKGVAPDSMIYSDKWPNLEGEDPMEVYKKIIEGKLRGENNIRVINNSWGLTDNNAILYKDVRNVLKEFKKVVDIAEKAGIQIVFAAGNGGEELGFPSIGTLSLFGLDVDKMTDEQQKDLDYILDKVILVGASNTQGTEDRNQHLLASFSSLGDSLNRKLIPTVIAPGVDMMVYGYEAGQRPKELVNGTSFAGPFVSGVIALMAQSNPKLEPAQIRKILKETAVKLPNLPDTYQGYGEVDPDAAIAKSKNYGKPSQAERTPEKPIALPKPKLSQAAFR